MAVQAQYPSSVLLLNRKIQEGKSILDNNDYGGVGGCGSGGFLDQSSHLIFHNNGAVDDNPRKRRRDLATTTGVNMNSLGFTLQNQNQNRNQNQNQNQNQNHQLIDLSLLQNQPNVVSTGLRLSFGDQNLHQQQIQQPTLFSVLSDDLSLQLKQQSDELNYFLQAQREQLRRTLEEKRRRHYHALLRAVEDAAARKMREKDTEIENVARRNAELEDQWVQLSTEAHSWRIKAQAQDAQAAALQAQIDQVNAGALQHDREGAGQSCAGGEGYADDSESVYVDPLSERRVNSLRCKVCRKRVASVVLLPCRHLCVCIECNAVVSACPLCLSIQNGSVEVFLT